MAEFDAGCWAVGLSGVRQAATRGSRLLQQGKSSTKAVEAAVMEMEDNPVSNAGSGSTLNLVGQVKADAGIMNGRTRMGAGVALLRHTKNSISPARLVMEKTDHALLAGKTAERLGEAFGLPKAILKLPERVCQWKQAKRGLEKASLAIFLEL